MKKTKAEYYTWLMKKHDTVTQHIKALPQISLEEQSKSATLIKYDSKNQKKVDYYNKILNQINEEVTRILPR